MNDNYLKRAEDPEQLKKMDAADLEALAGEIRSRILETVSRNGGHLASNLGVVEATLAIHRIFDPSRDRIIWDVGHQSYVHKMLTGRNGAFATLRQMGGISGFPKTEENPTDAFNTGHSTTSISAALGIARARDLQGGNYHVVAFIGDGSLTGGMAWEAMNDAGQRREKMIVILNDNEMSISRNVGSLASHLAQLRVLPWYVSFKHWIRDHIGAIPVVGQPIYRMLGKIRDRTKYSLIDRRGILFEEMGWTYVGPIDGHDLSRMEEVLSQVKKLDKPVLVHICTQKGKGYGPAEEHPEQYHSVGPFNLETGMEKTAPACADTVGKTLLASAWEDPKLVVVSAAMPDGFGLSAFMDRFPKRYFDVAIAEQHAVTMAAGMAAGGLHPVVCIYATFLQRAYDQILEDVCMQNLPITFCVSHAGISGQDGETHQGIYCTAYLQGMPNLTILEAADRTELRTLLRYALTLPGPVAVCYAKDLPEGKAEPPVPPSWYRVCGDGNRETAILTTGITVGSACRIAEQAHADVYNACILKPADEDTLGKLCVRYRTILTAEDRIREGSLSRTVADYVTGKELAVRLLSVTLPDKPVPHGSVKDLVRRFGLDEEGLLKRLREDTHAT